MCKSVEVRRFISSNLVHFVAADAEGRSDRREARLTRLQRKRASLTTGDSVARALLSQCAVLAWRCDGRRALDRKHVSHDERIDGVHWGANLVHGRF